MGIDTSGFSSLGSSANEIADDYGGDGNPEYRIVTNVRYAPHQEYGTSEMAAQPYMRPAVDDVRAELPQIIADAESTQDAVETAALRVLTKAKEYCPVDTGRLRASIRIEGMNGTTLGSTTAEADLGS